MKKIIEFICIVITMIGIVIGVVEFGQIGQLESISNLANVFSGLGWFLGAFFIASLFTAYLVVIAPTKFFFRFLAIPAWLVFSVALIVTVDQFMGYSYPAIPPQAKVIAYHVIKGPNNTKIIEAWMWIKEEKRARAYNFPHTPEREKAMRKAQQGSQKGEPVEINLRKGEGEPDGQKPESMIVYDWDLDADHPSKPQQGQAPTDMPEIPNDKENYEINSDGEIEVINPRMPKKK